MAAMTSFHEKARLCHFKSDRDEMCIEWIFDLMSKFQDGRPWHPFTQQSAVLPPTE